jgi:hypothetical protein
MPTSEQLRTFAPEDYPHEGCPVRVKTRHISVPKGINAIADWPMRTPDGAELDLSALFSTDESASESDSQGSITVRFATVDSEIFVDAEGECVSPSTGRIHVDVPDIVTRRAGIYRMQFGVEDADGNMVAIDRGLLFVEPSLFGSHLMGVNQGPPTIKEIRTYIRDTLRENDLLKDVEFDEDELMMAIISPIREWNELPPPVARHTTASFPYREHWMRAIIGHLCRMAAAWYSRNKLQTNFDGLSQDDRNKNQDYDARAMMYITEWRGFIRAKKFQINCGRTMASMDGPYY